MRNLQEVREARQLMKEAMEWSAIKWLWEKTRVRQTADRANAALEQQERAVKAKWDAESRAALKKVTNKKPASPRAEEAEPGDVQVELLIASVVEADRAARRARMDAEATFEEAEKQMSTSLAREGCKQAIHSWNLRQKAIRQAEGVANAAQEREPNRSALEGTNAEP